MKIRPASAADIPAMFELERQCPTAAHWVEEQYRGIFKAMGEGVLRHGFVIDGSDERVGGLGLEGAPLAGFLVARQSGTEWELENVVVAPVVRRRGLGTMLVHELFARVLRANGAAVFLEVRESNQAARHFYQKHGFEEKGRRSGYYSGPKEDAIVYQWKVGPTK